VVTVLPNELLLEQEVDGAFGFEIRFRQVPDEDLPTQTATVEIRTDDARIAQQLFSLRKPSAQIVQVDRIW
jgi:hypothetical protein